MLKHTQVFGAFVSIVGHIRAPLTKQHFISAAELLSKQRGQGFLRLIHCKYPLCLILGNSQDVNS